MPLKKYGFAIWVILLSFQLFAVADDQDYSKNVRRKSDGSVVIKNVPQVNQKGQYCVPGSVLMVLKYFDSGMNQDSVARILNANIDEGTSIADMMRGFSQRKLFDRCSIHEIYYLYDRDNRNEYDLLLRAYIDEKNKKTKSIKKREAELMRLKNSDFPLVEMDPKIAKVAFKKARADLCAQLVSVVKSNIDSGIPILWSVMLHFDPRDGRPGTHMRVIVGYTEKDGNLTDVFYSDSWGAQSVYQKVGLDDALTMTQGLWLVTPKSDRRSATDQYLARSAGGNLQQNATALLSRDIVLELVPVPAGNTIKAFFIGKYEVTQQQYRILMGKNFSNTKGEDYPVEKVTWEEAIEFCKRLTQIERKSGRITEKQAYTLPTRRQWVYACSAKVEPRRDDEFRSEDTYAPKSFIRNGKGVWAHTVRHSSHPIVEEFQKTIPDPLTDFAWVWENSQNTTHPVGKRKPNSLGIYDMQGNVSEWCRDRVALGMNFGGVWGGSPLRSNLIGFRVVLITIGEE